MTIATILLIIPLILLISYYTGISETGSQDVMGKMRCDELHYFVEDVKRDMQRSVTIFGRRSAIYALDHLVETGQPFEDYEFTCTPQCGVDCGEFFFDDLGSEAAIAELTMCGTLYGANVTYMVNHTIPEWIRNIESYAEKMHFILDLNVSEIKVVPMDAWDFALIVDYKIRVQDEEGMCYYTENIIQVISNSSIIGLEDPLYVLQTDGHILKYIVNCTVDLDVKATAGCSKSSLGNGVATGRIVYYSEIDGVANYCDITSDINDIILVMDKAIGSCNQFGDECWNISAVNHFAGVIDYGPNNINSIVNKCDVSIPWVLDTGKLDDGETGFGGGWARNPACDGGDISRDGCVVIYNDPICGIYEVRIGYDSNTTNTTCYYVSDIEEYYNTKCAVNYSNGPSFFDRLDGNLNLSEKYVSQSMEYFNTTLIGIETLVQLYELDSYHSIYPSIPVYANATWVDYLYWQGVVGCGVISSCEVGKFRLNLDCAHSFKHGVGTDCAFVSECYYCGDGSCDIGETCVSCPADCSCPSCPTQASLEICSTDIGSNKYDVTFTLTVTNASGGFDLSALPEINVTIEGIIADHTMNQIGVGTYEYTEAGVGKNDQIKGNVTLIPPLIGAGCPTLSDETPYDQAKSIPDTC